MPQSYFIIDQQNLNQGNAGLHYPECSGLQWPNHFRIQSFLGGTSSQIIMRGITQGQSEQKIIKEKRGPERSTKDSKSRIKHNLIPDRFHQIISIGSGLCLPSCTLFLLGFHMRRNGHKCYKSASMACTGRWCSGEGVCLSKDWLKLVSTCQVFINPESITSKPTQMLLQIFTAGHKASCL